MKSEQNSRALDDVFLDRKDVDESLLRDILVKYVKIEKESLSLIPTSEYEKMKQKHKVLICLLSRKAMKIRDMVQNENMRPVEISNIAGIKEGTVRPALRTYLKDGLVKENERGYFIPDYALERVKKEVMT
jgi:predicted transcriptional regulator